MVVCQKARSQVLKTRPQWPPPHEVPMSPMYLVSFVVALIIVRTRSPRWQLSFSRFSCSPWTLLPHVPTSIPLQPPPPVIYGLFPHVLSSRYTTTIPRTCTCRALPVVIPLASNLLPSSDATTRVTVLSRLSPPVFRSRLVMINVLCLTVVATWCAVALRSVTCPSVLIRTHAYTIKYVTLCPGSGRERWGDTLVGWELWYVRLARLRG